MVARTFVFAALLCLVGFVSPAEQTLADDIDRWIELLGHDSYKMRESASEALARNGLRAISALRAAQDHPDAEVRIRARRILEQLGKTELQEAVQAFLRDPEGNGKHEQVPAWPQFRDVTGDSPSARKLYGEILEAELPLLLAHQAKDPNLEMRFLGRFEKLLPEWEDSPFEQDSPSLGSCAMVVFLGGEIGIPAEMEYDFFRLMCYRKLSVPTTSGSKSAVLKHLMRRWILTGTNHNSPGYRLQIAFRYGLGPTAEKVALRTIENRDQYNLSSLKYAVLALGKYGYRQNLRPLESLLDDDRVGLEFMYAEQPIRVQIRDLALAVLVSRALYDLKDFGFDRVKRDRFYYFHPTSIYFEKDQQREAAVAKWHKHRTRLFYEDEEPADKQASF